MNPALEEAMFAILIFANTGFLSHCFRKVWPGFTDFLVLQFNAIPYIMLLPYRYVFFKEKIEMVPVLADPSGCLE